MPSLSRSAASSSIAWWRIPTSKSSSASSFAMSSWRAAVAIFVSAMAFSAPRGIINRTNGTAPVGIINLQFVTTGAVPLHGREPALSNAPSMRVLGVPWVGTRGARFGVWSSHATNRTPE
eukprot:2196521-Prymnesium_polylepis.1